MPHLPASDALSHIRVLDLTRVRSGPTAVRQLADWGADVIKIEQPEALEPEGSLGAGRATPDFQNLQRNKRSMTLNLKEDDGREILFRLVKTADVVVENFRPGVKKRLGIDYEVLKSHNPRIILASISGFGQDGPYAKRPGFDQIAQGMGGLMSVTGEPGRGPMRVGIPIADLTAGLFCALGILTAIIEREKSGEGQWLHTSLLQAQIFMLDFQAARWLMAEEVPPQVGNEHPTTVPTNVYPTKDGSMNVAVSGNTIFGRFCKALGKEVWIDEPKFGSDADRRANRVELNALIADVMKTRTTAEWDEILTAAGVPCGPIYQIDETFADPQVRHLGIGAEIETEPFGETRAVAQPVTLTRTPSRLVRGAPSRGAETVEVLSGLGFSEADIEDLRARTII